jgi:Lhr-like helicase
MSSSRTDHLIKWANSESPASKRRETMPFYQSDDYPPSVRVDDDIERLWRNFKALEERFNKLDETVGYLLLTVGEILEWWKHEEDKASR